jgi:hypothetical protein
MDTIANFSQNASSKTAEQIKEEIKKAWSQAAPFPIAENLRQLKVAVTVACQCKTQLEAALVYAKFGIPVLPCNWEQHQIEDGSYKVQKRPAFDVATTDSKQITRVSTVPYSDSSSPQVTRTQTENQHNRHDRMQL